MDSLVSIIKSNISKEYLKKEHLYERYYPQGMNSTELRRELYDSWFFWSQSKRLDGTSYIVFAENANLFQVSTTCIKYKLTKRFRDNIRYMEIFCPDDKEYMYLYIGTNLSEFYLNELLVESLLNYNSLHLLYFGIPLKYSRYIKKLLYFKERVQLHNLDIKNFVIVSSGILGMYGMREPTDIDMVTLEPEYKEICDKLIDCHHHVLKTYEVTVEDLVLNPNNYVFWNGIKFAALNVVYKACYNRIEKTKKIDGYFIRVIWGQEKPSVFELTKKRVQHYFIRTTREWKKNHQRYYEWRLRVKRRVIFCIKLPYLVCRKAYWVIRGILHEKNKN